MALYLFTQFAAMQVLGFLTGLVLAFVIQPWDYPSDAAYEAALNDKLDLILPIVMLAGIAAWVLVFGLLAQRAGYRGAGFLLVLVPVWGTVVMCRVLWRWTDIKHWQAPAAGGASAATAGSAAADRPGGSDRPGPAPAGALTATRPAELRVVRRPRERDHVADVLHPRRVHDRPLEAQAEPGVRDRAVAPQVAVPPVVVLVQVHLVQAPVEHVEALLALGCRR